MPGNLAFLPSFGKPITLDDQGIYYAISTATGAIHSILQLVYDDEWYLYQLQNANMSGEFHWVMLTGQSDYVLNSMTTEEIRHHFSKPEYAEPAGAWQVIKNSKFGFGKFTPLGVQESPSYGLLLFSKDEMRPPLLIHKADDDFLQETEGAMHQEVELV